MQRLDNDSDQLATTWAVYHQDDNGNRYVVETGLSYEQAERLVALYEARGHKQSYWAEADLK
jgi:hypothetical protein